MSMHERRLPTPAEIEEDHKTGAVTAGIAVIAGILIGLVGVAFVFGRML